MPDQVIIDFSDYGTAELFVWELDHQLDELNNQLEWCRAVNNDVAASTHTSIRSYSADAAKRYNAKTGKNVSATFFNSKVQRAVKITACIQEPKCAAKLDKYVVAARKAGEDVTLYGLYMFLFPAKTGKGGKPTLVDTIKKVESVDELDAIIAAAQARKAELVKLAKKAA
jgi:hypothetical protein